MPRPDWPVAGSTNNAAETKAVIDDAQATLDDHETRVTTTESTNTAQTQRLDTLQYRRPTVAAIGDSITNPQYWSFPHWSCLQPTSKLQFTNSYGHAGYTAAQILTSGVPEVIAADPRPGFCYVLAGTNDSSDNDSFASFSAAYADILDTLIEANIFPVPLALPPNTSLESNAAYRLQLHTFNLWIQRQASARGLPFINWWSKLVDPDTYCSWASGYSDDTVHPNLDGYKVMGEELERQLTPYLAGISLLQENVLATANLDPTNLVINGLFSEDANADGLGDDWTLYGGAGYDATASLETPSDGLTVGNWQRMTMNDGNANFSRIYSKTAITAVAGHRYQAAFRYQSDLTGDPIAVPGGTFFMLNANYTSGSLAADGKGMLSGGGANPSRSITSPVTVYREFIADDAAATTRMVMTNNSGEGWMQIAQVTLRDLTALGVV